MCAAALQAFVENFGDFQSMFGTYQCDDKLKFGQTSKMRCCFWYSISCKVLRIVANVFQGFNEWHIQLDECCVCVMAFNPSCLTQKLSLHFLLPLIHLKQCIGLSVSFVIFVDFIFQNILSSWRIVEKDTNLWRSVNHISDKSIFTALHHTQIQFVCIASSIRGFWICFGDSCRCSFFTVWHIAGTIKTILGVHTYSVHACLLNCE